MPDAAGVLWSGGGNALAADSAGDGDRAGLGQRTAGADTVGVDVWSLPGQEEPNSGLLSQLAASPVTVSGTPSNSPAGLSWPPSHTAQPHSFCASASIAYR
jgi:hypothetical protein